MKKKTDAEIDAEIDAWFQKHGNEPVSEPIFADLVEFDFKKRLLILYLSNSRRFVLPLEDLQGLDAATREQLEDYDLQEGQGIEWPSLGVAYRVDGLIEGSYGTQHWMQELRRKSAVTESKANQKSARGSNAKSGKQRKDKVPA